MLINSTYWRFILSFLQIYNFEVNTVCVCCRVGLEKYNKIYNKYTINNTDSAMNIWTQNLTFQTFGHKFNTFETAFLGAFVNDVKVYYFGTNKLTYYLD